MKREEGEEARIVKRKTSHNSLRNVKSFRLRKVLCEIQSYAQCAWKSNSYTSDKLPNKCFVNSMGNDLSSLFKSLTEVLYSVGCCCSQSNSLADSKLPV